MLQGQRRLKKVDSNSDNARGLDWNAKLRHLHSKKTFRWRRNKIHGPSMLHLRWVHNDSAIYRCVMHLLEPLNPGVSKIPAGTPALATSLKSNYYIGAMVRYESTQQGKRHTARQPNHQTAEQSKSPAPRVLSNAQSDTLCPLTAVCRFVHSGIPSS